MEQVEQLGTSRYSLRYQEPMINGFLSSSRHLSSKLTSQECIWLFSQKGIQLDVATETQKQVSGPACVCHAVSTIHSMGAWLALCGWPRAKSVVLCRYTLIIIQLIVIII